MTYRFATGASKGKKAMVLRSVPDADHSAKAGLVVKNSGFSLHAGVATKAHERDRLEKICRYIARPALSEERLSTNVRGEVIYKLKKPWNDGTTAVKFTPLELMEKLAALVPRPRVHLTRFHGVLAPHYKFRKQIVPKKPELFPPLDLIQTNQKPKPKPETKRMSWAKLLKRVFNIDISICPRCQGRMRILAAIEDPKIVRKILDHLGIPSSPPQLGQPRGPPPSQQEDLFTQSFPEY